MRIDFRVRVPRLASEPKADNLSRYDELMDISERSKAGADELLAEMDSAGVDKAVLHAEFEAGDYRQYNNAVADLCRRYPDRFVGFGSVDARDGMAAVRELNRCVQELGLRGLNLQPFVSGLHADHRLYYLLYVKCIEYGIPVGLHTGVNYSTNHPIDFGNPLRIDYVMCDLPELVVVALHTGWPWIEEVVAVARKHSRLHLEIGGVAPKYIGQPGSGWETFYRFANSVLQDQILFGTDWPAMLMQRAVSEADGLALKPAVREKFLWQNAAKLLGMQGV